MQLNVSPDVAALNPHIFGHTPAPANSAKAKARSAKPVERYKFDSRLELRAWSEWVPTQNFVTVKFKRIILRLDSGNYTPDFFAVTQELEMWFVEVKGAWEAYQSGRSSKKSIKEASVELACMGRFFVLMPGKGEWVLREVINGSIKAADRRRACTPSL